MPAGLYSTHGSHALNYRAELLRLKQLKMPLTRRCPVVGGDDLTNLKFLIGLSELTMKKWQKISIRWKHSSTRRALSLVKSLSAPKRSFKWPRSCWIQFS